MGKEGWPVIRPLDEMVNPLGRPPAAQLYGVVPPVACIWNEYGVLIAADGSDVVVIWSGMAALAVSGRTKAAAPVPITIAKVDKADVT
jgi:hypothetical protein